MASASSRNRHAPAGGERRTTLPRPPVGGPWAGEPASGEVRASREVARLTLGIGQMLAAAIALVLLLTQGVTAFTVGVAGAASLLTAVSTAIFGSGWHRPSRSGTHRP